MFFVRKLGIELHSKIFYTIDSRDSDTKQRVTVSDWLELPGERDDSAFLGIQRHTVHGAPVGKIVQLLEAM